LPHPFDISDTAAIITGASRGIGLAIARHFLAGGANVVLGGVDAVETRAATERLSIEFGVDCVAGLAGDISQSVTAQSLVDLALQRFGRLDTVVCNAGIDIIKPAIDYEQEEWDRILSVNLRGAFLPAQAAAQFWIENRQAGNVILTSSIIARAGVAGLAPYGASKGGVDQLVRGLAVEWAPHRIRVNAVAPGYVDNVMAGVKVHADPESDKRIEMFTPLGRRATVDEIAAPFVFLASPAANYITGAVLAVDGGYTAQ
jgi:NAD(P)-dependent dehydrogenase (short-subunit alcohol dehydrogenase family)